MFKSKILIVASLVLFCIIGASARSCVSVVPQTGQTESYEVVGSDGDLQRGMPWSDPRFTDNLDGTVTDNLTGLIWLKEANRFERTTWAEALSDCNNLADDGIDLTDGSVAGDWRLPNVKELHSLIDYGHSSPALPSSHPFENVQSWHYWSSTTIEYNTYQAWLVTMYYGLVHEGGKGYADYYVWPVRGGN